MVRVGDGHIVDEKSVFVAVSASDVDAGIECVRGYDAGHGGEVFQYVLFTENGWDPLDSFDGREDSPAGREGGDDNFFQVVLFVAQGNDERSVAFVELVSFFFIVDVRKFQRARNGTF